jgi:hypothetical protein
MQLRLVLILGSAVDWYLIVHQHLSATRYACMSQLLAARKCDYATATI